MYVLSHKCAIKMFSSALQLLLEHAGYSVRNVYFTKNTNAADTKLFENVH